MKVHATVCTSSTQHDLRRRTDWGYMRHRLHFISSSHRGHHFRRLDRALRLALRLRQTRHCHLCRPTIRRSTASTPRCRKRYSLLEGHTDLTEGRATAAFVLWLHRQRCLRQTSQPSTRALSRYRACTVELSPKVNRESHSLSVHRLLAKPDVA